MATTRQTPSDLIALAVTSGANADQLEKLMNLQERWQKQQAEAAFNRAMQEFQSRCPSIMKNATASIKSDRASYSYTFASLDHIAETIRPLMSELGLSYEFNSVIDGQVMHVDCIIHHVDGHFRSSRFSAPIDSGASRMSKPQQCGSALTFCRRYSLTMALGICTADSDSDAAIKGRQLRGTAGSGKVARPVDASDLKDLRAAWVEVNPGEVENRGAFLAWCSGITDVDINILSEVNGWQPEDLQSCFNALK